MAYVVEYTDTFGGQANYSWVQRAVVRGLDDAPWPRVLREARKLLGLTGVRGDVMGNYGDEWWWKPRGMATVMMVRWSDDPHEVGEGEAGA